MMRSSAGSLTWTPFGLLLWVSIFTSVEMSEAREKRIQKRSSHGEEAYLLPVEPDMSVCKELLGKQQPAAIENVPWYCICSHCKGTDGPKGDQGDRGFLGRPGRKGVKGVTGIKGSTGIPGPTGLKGQKGDKGEKGGLGHMGSTGPKGEPGDEGTKGDHGLEGRPGWQGPKGDAGQCKEQCSIIRGPQGPKGSGGPTGEKGSDGPPGALGAKGAVGSTGEKGVMGMKGLLGSEGRKGEKGVEGPCYCQDGAHGIHGSQGPPGPKGDKGDTGDQGEKDVTGEKGDMGWKGMKGMPGPCSPAMQSAFSASMASSVPKPNLPVPFRRIHYNVQKHYDPAGKYTAPINGAYVFSYHLAVSANTVLNVGLFGNFAPIEETIVNPNGGTASQQVMLYLSTGDEVWLQVNDTRFMYADTESSSTFSGFLFHPDTCDMPIVRAFQPPPPITGE